MKTFMRELKRRRVLHTASFYVVGAWVALQVGQLLDESGMPILPMHTLLLLLSLGFPVALIIGWFFDISKDGVVRTGPLREGESLPRLRFIDHVLLAGLLLVVAVDIRVLTAPRVEDPVLQDTGARQRTVAVLSFEDVSLPEGGEPVGEVLAGELRESLTRTAGLRVLGPATSKALYLAGDDRDELAAEHSVTALLAGDIRLEGGRIRIDARLVAANGGNRLWTGKFEGTVAESIALQRELLKQVVAAVAPNLDPDPVQGARVGLDDCSTVYDRYLRGKQMSQARKTTQAERYQRGMQLLREVVDEDPGCALAWDAIALGTVDYTMPGFVKAGVAARRALELNDTLPDSWAVLAEIAEQEGRWNDSEEYFLRALGGDPTNVRANMMYSEALLARGRARDALRYALDAYHYEPHSTEVNMRITMAAHYANVPDLGIRHTEIWEELAGTRGWMIRDTLADFYVLKGEIYRAIEVFDGIWSVTNEMSEDDAAFVERHAVWAVDCVRAREDPGLQSVVREQLAGAFEQWAAGQLGVLKSFRLGWTIARCAIWIGDIDLLFEQAATKGVPPFVDGLPTEALFMNMFHPYGNSIRQDSRFRDMVVESGLLNYWKRWGWADMCRPEGDSFQCD